MKVWDAEEVLDKVLIKLRLMKDVKGMTSGEINREWDKIDKGCNILLWMVGGVMFWLLVLVILASIGWMT